LSNTYLNDQDLSVGVEKGFPIPNSIHSLSHPFIPKGFIDVYYVSGKTLDSESTRQRGK
jgi:hypothetical protein